MRGAHLVAVALTSLTLACQSSVTPREPTPDASSGARLDASGADASGADARGGVDAGADASAPAAPNTRALLDDFWADHGGRGAFSQLQLDAVEAMLLAEDDVLAGRYAEARARVDAVFAAYPESDPIWWSTPVPQGLNLGTPVAYYGLRMLDDIARGRGRGR